MKKVRNFGLSAIFLALTSSYALAYITDPLPPSTYISNSGLDWTWVSPWGTLYEGVKFASPSAHEGWRYASVSELQYLFDNLVNDFINGGTPIQSVAYWELDGTNWVDQSDLRNSYIMSGPNFFNSSCRNNVCDVFYVRDANGVPLPSTLALFGIAAFALGLTRREKKIA